ncbi:MAG: hypothetical protein ACI361_08960 [Atopobiaceae bacterium]
MDEEAEYTVPSDDEERREARKAGEQALKSLKEARGYLAKASSWGLVDIFGGNFISGALKHAHLAEARDAIVQAKRDVQAFQNELGDVRDVEHLKIDVDGFLEFADFVFDGAIADILVQSRIEKAKDSVDDAIASIERALRAL